MAPRTITWIAHGAPQNPFPYLYPAMHTKPQQGTLKRKNGKPSRKVGIGRRRSYCPSPSDWARRKCNPKTGKVKQTPCLQRGGRRCIQNTEEIRYQGGEAETPSWRRPHTKYKAYLGYGKGGDVTQTAPGSERGDQPDEQEQNKKTQSCAKVWAARQPDPPPALSGGGTAGRKTKERVWLAAKGEHA